MNNYLLSIDPSLTRTGFTLWKEQCEHDKLDKECEDFICEKNWNPIWIESYSFKQITKGKRYEWSAIKDIIEDKVNHTFFEIVIEKAFNNPRFVKGNTTGDYLRGYIVSQFNKFPDKEFQKKYMPLPKEWRKRILERLFTFKDFMPEEEDLVIINKYKERKVKKLQKEDWLIIALLYCKYMNWEFTSLNHDQAESLLIGWDFITKDIK